VHEQKYDPSGRTTGSGTSTATETAKQAADTAKQAAQDVAGAAKEQGHQVAHEMGTQTRSVVSDVRQSVTGQVRTGHSKLADGLRQFSDELGSMSGRDSNSPATRVVQQLGDTGRRAADYLQDRGPDGLLDDVQDFARRKPGTFLLAAAAAGFVIGRLGRSTMKAVRSDDKPQTETSYRSGPSGGEGGLYSSGTAAGYDTGSTFVGGAAYDTVPPTTLDDPYATPVYEPRETVVGTTGTETGTGYDEAGSRVDPAGGVTR
jgi:hypothetical protein